MSVIEILIQLFCALSLYGLSVFVFFNQKRNRVNVWFFILLNTLSGIYMFCFLHNIPSLNIVGEYSLIMWESLETFFLSILPFILLAYVNVKTRFQENKWIMYGSFLVLSFLSAEISMLWSDTLFDINRQAWLMLSISAAFSVCLYVVSRTPDLSSIYIKLGLGVMIISPVITSLELSYVYVSLYIFGVLLFVDLRRYNAKTLHKKEVAQFIVNKTADAIIVTDVDDTIIYCNKNARVRLGLSILSSNGAYLDSIMSLNSGKEWELVKRAKLKVDFNVLNKTEDLIITFSEIKRKDKVKGYVLIF